MKNEASKYGKALNVFLGISLFAQIVFMCIEFANSANSYGNEKSESLTIAIMLIFSIVLTIVAMLFISSLIETLNVLIQKAKFNEEDYYELKNKK